MKINLHFFRINGILLILLIMSYVAHSQNNLSDTLKVSIDSALNRFLNERVNSDSVFTYKYYRGRGKIMVDSFELNSPDSLTIYFNKYLSEMVWRTEYVASFASNLKTYLPDSLNSIRLNILSNQKPLNELIPNYYREEQKFDKQRLPQKKAVRRQRGNIVSRTTPYTITKGLKNSNIALWNSHGYYYEGKLDRWEWQRARLFTTIEDLYSSAIIIPYLLPMLENAGANVLLPKERDLQKNEVIVDNDGSTANSEIIIPKKAKKSGKKSGFAHQNPPYTTENPFLQGTYLEIVNSPKSDSIIYLPEIPENGEYAVYISYAKGDSVAKYRVNHSGGATDFDVDQTMGFGTWIYLGRFHFQQGKKIENASVVLYIPEVSNQNITADAVRFGGGMGVISRKGKSSEHLKFYEAARYYLQYAGAPDTLVWDLNKGKKDYNDDYQSRGEWVNWLMGKPFGPNRNRNAAGLEIPIDLSFALHTDAGILQGDSIVGTLGIYATKRDEGRFPDGQSKYASRDLTDIVMSQIVEDINAKYNVNWTRRGLWDASYSEAYRPNVPAMLLELLSHQNLNDIKYGLNPQFRFNAARAIYKGMLRFLSVQHNFDYVVQPLPVDHLYAEISGENKITINWKPTTDSLEKTAKPTAYMVYRRIGENGWDNGKYTADTILTLSDLRKNICHSFKVTAVNAGGESFPSEIITVGLSGKNDKKILIVNGFDRTEGPEFFIADSLSGVLRYLDNGVSQGFDFHTTGAQYDFDRKSEWLDDDSPGHGASYADLETKTIAGNTSDFAYWHGKSILAANYSFVSISDEAFEKQMVKTDDYWAIDLLFGEEKTSYLPGNENKPEFSIYTDGLISTLKAYTKKGGNIIISGAYIGTDIGKDTNKIKQIGNLLKYKWRTNHAVKNGDFYDVSSDFNYSGAFNTSVDDKLYTVEAPDAIEPFDKNAETIFRYKENNTSAGVYYNGDYKVVALGFPFECVKNQNKRDELMKHILNLLNL